MQPPETAASAMPRRWMAIISAYHVVQAQSLLGTAADDLAPMKEGGEASSLARILQKAQWTEWIFNIRSQCQ